MRLLDRLTAPFSRPRPWRLLRQVLGVLGRIAAALEEQNALMRALHPDAAARLKGAEPEIESGVSYVDPMETLRAEQVRMELYRQTGRYLDDDQLMDYLQSQDLIAATKTQGLS